MKRRDVIRAWRDGEFYSSLTDEQRAAMPESPASVIDLSDEILSTISGGCSMDKCPTSGYCSPCPAHCY